MTASRPRDREDLLLNLANALSDQPRASMEQLAGMVGLSRATLCRHFASRDAMLQAMSVEALTSAELALGRARPNEGAAEQAILRLIDELLPIAELYAFTWDQEHGYPALEARTQALRASFTALFHQWQARGELRVDLPAAWLVESMSALLRSAAAMIRSGRLAATTPCMASSACCGAGFPGSSSTGGPGTRPADYRLIYRQPPFTWQLERPWRRPASREAYRKH